MTPEKSEIPFTRLPWPWQPASGVLDPRTQPVEDPLSIPLGSTTPFETLAGHGPRQLAKDVINLAAGAHQRQQEKPAACDAP